MGQDLPDDQRVVRPEPALERRLQLGKLGPQTSPGQLSEYLGIVAAGDKRVEHVPT